MLFKVLFRHIIYSIEQNVFAVMILTMLDTEKNLLNVPNSALVMINR